MHYSDKMIQGWRGRERRHADIDSDVQEPGRFKRSRFVPYLAFIITNN